MVVGVRSPRVSVSPCVSPRRFLPAGDGAPRCARPARARSAPRKEPASMSETVGDFILQRLTDWGLRRIFGFPGDGINGIMGAMGRAADRFDYVRVRHEEMAAFMAGGHAK